MKSLLIALALVLAIPVFAEDAAKAPAAPATVAAPAGPAVVLPAVAVPAPAPLIAAPPVEKSSIIQTVVNFLEGIPAVGKLLSLLFQILSVVAVALTALSTMLIAVSAACEQIGKKLPILSKMSAWINALLPWVKYASMYNKQKEVPAAKSEQPAA